MGKIYKRRNRKKKQVLYLSNIILESIHKIFLIISYNQKDKYSIYKLLKKRGYNTIESYKLAQNIDVIYNYKKYGLLIK